MAEFLKDFAEWKWYWKALVILGLPLLLLLIFVGGGDYVRAWLNDRARKKTDDKAAEIDGKIKQTDQDIAHQQGVIDEIKKEKTDAEQKAKQDDPTDFYDHRYKPTDDK